MNLLEAIEARHSVRKCILFLHGFFASGQCVPAVALREAFEGRAEVLTPDLPIHPNMAMELIRNICDREHPDLLVGNYAGGIAWYKGTTPPDDEVGIPQVAYASASIFPNPASSQVKVSADFRCDKVLVYNLQGQCVTEQAVANGTFSVANLPAGMYILRFYRSRLAVGAAKIVKN